MRTKLLSLATVLGMVMVVLVVLPAAPAAAAKPAPTAPAVSITLTQGVDEELGTPALFATYSWSGFTGKVNPHVTISMDGTVATQVDGYGYSGRKGTMGVLLAVEEAPAAHTFVAEGWLTSGRKDTLVPGSTVSSAPLTISFVAAPCS